MATKQHWYEINLVTLSDIQHFVSLAETLDIDLILTDENGIYRVNAKSLLGVRYSCEWTSLYLISDEDVYMHFRDYIKASYIKTI